MVSFSNRLVIQVSRIPRGIILTTKCCPLTVELRRTTSRCIYTGEEFFTFYITSKSRKEDLMLSSLLFRMVRTNVNWNCSKFWVNSVAILTIVKKRFRLMIMGLMIVELVGRLITLMRATIFYNIQFFGENF